jgi:hypothetical protein
MNKLDKLVVSKQIKKHRLQRHTIFKTLKSMNTGH